MDLSRYGVINMLNAKYLVFGPQRNNVITNPSANGNAWFVHNVVTANSPNEELEKLCQVDTRTTAVVNTTEFNVGSITPDSTASINLVDHNPNQLKYESQSQQEGLVIFSEIYYPTGWVATIDGAETELIRADYVLRAVIVPPGKHTIELEFRPPAYVTGNKITTASSWLMWIVLLGSVGWTLKKSKYEE
jgi:hypothetical protein